jgi:hypothetical protein
MLAQLNKYIFGLDEPPGPRDVDALVAKYCPPETRRMPTHADPAPGGETEGVPRPAGPHTAVIPRDATPAKGKRARTETFATNVELESMLERATPLFPIQAITDEPDLESEELPKTSHRSIPRAEREAERDARPLPVPGRNPPSRGLLVMAALGTLVLGGAALAMFLRAKNPDSIDAGIGVATGDANSDSDDASAMSSDAMPMVGDALVVTGDVLPVIIDASPIVHDAKLVTRDAGAHDASVHDASPRTRPDAREAIPTIDAPRAVGNGLLKIGANPWGEVIVDGITRGRTPLELTLPAGKHTIEIVFKGEDPPLTQKKTVELKSGETQSVDADFTK